MNVGDEFDLRIAMISIDNAVELTIKTYFARNKRNLGLDRKVLHNPNFPGLLDTLAKINPKMISNEELDTIEHLHKVRNSLYHEGNGITVEINIVRHYANIAKFLLSKLFKIGLKDDLFDFEEELNAEVEFLNFWHLLEVKTAEIYTTGTPYTYNSFSESINYLTAFSIITKKEAIWLTEKEQIYSFFLKNKKIPKKTNLKETNTHLRKIYRTIVDFLEEEQAKE